ncbi:MULTISPECIES: hypothetical protein [unclassified Clostridium]|uniref:hypothetical protein n=1 Tax=unclassified Clostridium TaxID=2614128 RepID=UPI0002978526|nr:MULTISPECIES: hypothetical protein [unclassified Clostridium]EKQ54291.1 MAG: hypothetical protein A370_03339 [Clostridium sp. Maddingley MBC34-26]
MSNDNEKFDNEFSDLSTEDVFFLRQVEKRINEHHNPPVCLIAYDKQNEDK